MDWLFELVDFQAINFREKNIHCKTCQVSGHLQRNENEYNPLTKCCRFSPFWSAFAVGAYLEKEKNFPTLTDNRNYIFTELGIIHKLEDRLNPKSLCQFYSLKSGDCRIWSQRPATCLTFFCTSGFSGGRNQQSQLEDLLMQTEARLLKEFFFHNQKSQTQWQSWADFMDKVPKKPLSEDLIINDPQIAAEHYLKSFHWLKSLKQQTQELEVFKRNLNNWLQQYQSLC